MDIYPISDLQTTRSKLKKMLKIVLNEIVSFSYIGRPWDYCSGGAMQPENLAIHESGLETQAVKMVTEFINDAEFTKFIYANK